MNNVIQRAAIYARYSTDKQRKESVDDQNRVCTTVAEKNGWDVVACYDDPGISGGTAKRPGYQNLLAAARRREFDVVIAEDLSRLWREQAEMHRAIKEWKDLGLHLCTANGSVDSRQQGYDVLIAVLGVAAEMYRTEGAYRTRRGLEGRARKGLPTGGRAFGYLAAKDSPSGDIAVDATAASIVHRIFKSYVGGKSPRRIAAELNTDGIPSPGAVWNRKERCKDGKWRQTAVRAILRNERYTGNIVWGRMRWQRGAADSSKRTKHLGSDPVKTPRDDLRIIDECTWQAAQQRIRENKIRAGVKNAVARPHKHPLSGLLKCKACGASYVIADSHSYACASYRETRGTACDNGLRQQRIAMELDIFNGIIAQLTTEEFLDGFCADYRRFLDAGSKGQKAAAAANAKRRAEVEREIANIARAIKAGIVTRTTKAELEGCEKELERLTREQSANQGNVVTLIPRLRERFKAVVKSLPAIATRDPDRARVLLRRLFGQIWLVPENGRLVAEIEVTGSRMALSSGVIPGHSEIGGSGGLNRIWLPSSATAAQGAP